MQYEGERRSQHGHSKSMPYSSNKERQSGRRTRQSSSRGKATTNTSPAQSKPSSPKRHAAAAVASSSEAEPRSSSDSRFEAFAARMSTDKEVKKRRSRSFSNAPLPSTSILPPVQTVKALKPALVIHEASNPPPRPPRNAARRLSVQIPDANATFIGQTLTAMDSVGLENYNLSSPGMTTSASSSSALASPISIAHTAREQRHDHANPSALAVGLTHEYGEPEPNWEHDRRLSSLFSGLGFSGSLDFGLSKQEKSDTGPESDAFESAEEGTDQSASFNALRYSSHSMRNSQTFHSYDATTQDPVISSEQPTAPQSLAELNRQSAASRASQEYSWLLSSLPQRTRNPDSPRREAAIYEPVTWSAEALTEDQVHAGMAHSTSERNVRAWLPTVIAAASPVVESPELSYTEPSTPTSSTHELSSQSQDEMQSPDTSWQASRRTSVSRPADLRAKRQSYQAIPAVPAPYRSPPGIKQLHQLTSPRSAHSPKKMARQRSKTAEKIGSFFTGNNPRRARSTTSGNDNALPVIDKKEIRRRSQSFSAKSNTVHRSPLQSTNPANRMSPLQGTTISPASPSLHGTPMVQTTFRSSLPKRDYERLRERYGNAELKRQEVIWELCDTEESFINGLRGVIRVFMQPLRTQSGRWIDGIPSTISRLFDWLDDILQLHSQISSTLRSAQSAQQPIVSRIADVFLPFVTRLEVHQPYIVRFAQVTQMIDAMTSDSNSDFGEFVRMQQGLPECGSMTLSSFLLKPVQRLMKYPLFFKQLSDLTPPAHPDHLATLSLLHSTDVTIRVMQEVKAREEEYDHMKVLESQIRGLPEGFRLAKRDRKLLTRGLLRRVHISDRDQLRLGVESLSSAQRQHSSGDRLSPVLATFPDDARPRSMASDSIGSDGSSSFAHPASTVSSFNSSTYSPALSFSPNMQTESATQPSSLSSASSTNKSSAGASDSRYVSIQSQQETAQVLHTKAKETPLHVFIFNDLVVLTTKHKDSIKLIRSTKEKTQKEYFKLVEGIGLCRILGVEDISGRTEFEHLMDVDLLPISSESELYSISLCDASLASSIYLAVPPVIASASRSRSAHAGLRSNEANAKEHEKWLTAFERSFFSALRSLSFPVDLHYAEEKNHSLEANSSDRLSFASIVDSGLPMPKSPSHQDMLRQQRAINNPRRVDPDYDVEEERQERGWWAARLKKVRREWQAEEAALLQARMMSGIASSRFGGRSAAASSSVAGFQDTSKLLSASALRKGPRAHPVNGRTAQETVRRRT